MATTKSMPQFWSSPSMRKLQKGRGHKWGKLMSPITPAPPSAPQLPFLTHLPASTGADGDAYTSSPPSIPLPRSWRGVGQEVSWQSQKSVLLHVPQVL